MGGVVLKKNKKQPNPKTKTHTPNKTRPTNHPTPHQTNPKRTAQKPHPSFVCFGLFFLWFCGVGMFWLVFCVGLCYGVIGSYLLLLVGGFVGFVGWGGFVC